MRRLGAGDEHRDDARLVVSELVGNAVRHARPLADGTMHVAWTTVDSGCRHRRHRRRRPDHTRTRRGRCLRPRRPRPLDRRDARRPLVGREHPLPHHRARPARPRLTDPQARPARPDRLRLVFAAWERSLASATAPTPPRPPTAAPEPSVRASPARAARVAATRPATAARPAHRPPSSPVRSRAWRARPTWSRCASSSRPPPRRCPPRQRPHGPALLAAARPRHPRWSARTAPSGSGSRSSTRTATRAATWPPY